MTLIAVHLRTTIEPALVGLALVYTLQMLGTHLESGGQAARFLSGFSSLNLKSLHLAFSGVVVVVINAFITLESNMTSMERVIELANVPREEPQPGAPAPKPWPSQGRITFDNVRLRYRDHLPLALKGFSLEIRWVIWAQACYFTVFSAQACIPFATPLVGRAKSWAWSAGLAPANLR